MVLKFDIRDHIEFDRSGRAACPSCIIDGKTKQKNLSVDLSNGRYHCFRQCTSAQIRAALGVPKSQPSTGTTKPQNKHQSPQSQSKTVTAHQVQQAQQRLLNQQGEPQQQAIAWLESRGFSREMIEHFRLGLEQWWCTPDEKQPSNRQFFWAISVYIPSGKPEQYYRKRRIVPWLGGNDRPDYLPKWSQYGVQTTIWYTYRPDQAEATRFCEGEWDAMRLGWLAQQREAKVAVCCSTSGCGTIPSHEQLEQIPGEVTIFFDRNDEPTKNGSIPGDDGAKKLARALGDRAKIAQVPMSDDCGIRGWDVSNALDAGYSWADFEAAAAAAVALTQIEEPQSEVTLRDRLLEIFDQSRSAFERELALLNIAQETCYSFREIENLAKSLELEQAAEFDQAEAAQKLMGLLQTQRTKLDLTRYLEPWFANLLLKTANAMPTAPEFLFTTLLPVAASRIGAAAQVIIKASAKYVQPMIFNSMVAAGSGSLKSPSQQVIINPLYKLENEAYEIYLTEVAEHQSNKIRGNHQDNAQEAQKLPTRKRFIFSDATLETLQRIHAENPRGLLGYCDELAGAFKMRNAYRRGHGGDEEAELSQWNGSATIVDRAEKSVCLPKTAISRTGSIQWGVLAELMGDHRDENGAWSRWLICAADAPPRYINLLEDDQDTGIAEALTTLYVELGKIPQRDYLLSLQAKQLFQPWQHQLVNTQRTEDNAGLQLIYPKIEAYTARLALWLHIVNAVLRGETPTQLIDGQTMEKAIELAAYYLWQHRLIHAQNSPDSGLAAIALKIQQFADRVGAVTASRLKSGIRALRKMTAAEIRQLMLTLANAGYGRVSGEGSEMQYVPLSINNQSHTSVSSQTLSEAIDSVDGQLPTKSNFETIVDSDSQPLVDQIDTIDATAITEEVRQLEQEIEPVPSQGAINNTSTASEVIDTENCNLQVGDVCRYVGSKLRQLKGLDHLSIEAISDTHATVRAPSWYISHQVSLADLVKRGGQNG